jgi:hypothetical protein
LVYLLDYFLYKCNKKPVWDSNPKSFKPWKTGLGAGGGLVSTVLLGLIEGFVGSFDEIEFGFVLFRD